MCEIWEDNALFFCPLCHEAALDFKDKSFGTCASCGGGSGGGGLQSEGNYVYDSS